MTAEIISVGTELLLGNILNTNAQYLSRELAALGITVRRQSTIGDNHDRLADFVNEAKQRCDLLVFTGGLGPTADDLTKETVAACFGDTLTFDPEEWQKIVDFFTRTGRETTPNNRKQAMVPVHGHKVVNHHGTAPGAWFEQDGHCAVLMPGVPHEMKAMWEESVRPLLLARQSCALHSLTLRVLGGESNLEYRVRALLENPNPTAAIYCKTGECEIRITARAQNDTEAQTMCRAYAKKFYDLLGDAVYDEDVAGLEETVVHTLRANGLTIATAESCTGGMIAQRLTNVSGASEVFGYGFVTYWEQAKAKLVGVDPAVIAQYNVVSAPVAAQMALGAAKAAGADIAVSVTGLAGPGGGDAVRPVGTVYLGAARGDRVYVKKLFVSRPDRALIRARAAQTALELGFLYALVAMALFLSYRILDIADMTTDGCFVLGAAVSVSLTTAGHPILAIPAAMLAGACAGFATAFLQTRLGVPSILAGIVTNTGLYTVNLMAMGWKANQSLLGGSTIFTLLRDTGIGGDWYELLLAAAVTILAGALLLAFLGTRIGLSIRATGDNPDMVRASSLNPAFTITVGLCVANALTALSGAMVGQYQKTVDINSGTGIVVIGLACLIIGETVLGRRTIAKGVLAVMVGSVIYRFIYAVVFYTKIVPVECLKLLTAVIVALAIAAPSIQKWAAFQKRKLAAGKGGNGNA